MNYTVFDIEADGLIDTVTKIHCLSYEKYSDDNLIERKSFTNYEDIRSFILSQEILIGHNIVEYDIPVLKKLLNIEIKATLIDTLGLSWYLFPTEMKNGKSVSRKRHGLEAWGIHYNIDKPKINDWNNLSIEDYINRCETDVKINSLLWKDEYNYLLKLYDNNISDIFRFIGYITFKLDCIREQEENPCYIDKESCERNLIVLNEEIEKKSSELSMYMPLQKKYKTIHKPEKFYKKDGEISAAGLRWNNWIEELHLDKDIESFEQLINVESGNPNSSIQIKEWLFSLGWQPTIFKEAISKVTGKAKENPQISDDNGNICPNIKHMFKDYPYLSNLENLTLMRHRKGIFESFLSSLSPNNTVVASIGGFTNTLRMRHKKPIVNLPKVGTYLGKEIRSLIVVPNNNYLVCGSDIHALEDTTKQHYMYFFDPEYVKQMRVPGFDPHLDIALLAGLMTQEEVDTFKALKKKENRTEEENKIYHKLEEIRFNAKTLNFSGIYGAGAPKLAKTLNSSLEFAKKLHSTYWKRNKAVREVVANAITKKVNDQLWLYNPISRFWYSLRTEKDLFSTLNQGAGAYVEDRWIFHMRKKGLKMILQYHDETAQYLKKEDMETVRNYINESMEEVNKELRLNVPISVSIDFGTDYSQIH